MAESRIEFDAGRLPLWARRVAVGGLGSAVLVAGGAASKFLDGRGIAQAAVLEQPRVTPDDPSVSVLPAAYDDVHAFEGWAYTETTPVEVAVVDTGVNPVSDIKDNLLSGHSTVPGNESDTSDQKGHGTEIASIIAGKINDGEGVAGIYPSAQIVPVKIDGGSFSGGLKWAAEQPNIRVINYSVYNDQGKLDQDAVAAIKEAHDNGKVVVTIAGNGTNNDGHGQNIDLDNPNAANPLPAAVSKYSIVVGGNTLGDSVDSSSNYGDTVDIEAPFSFMADNPTSQNPPAPPIEVFGTSYSAAVVSGAAAELIACNPTLSPDAVKNLLVSTATPGADASKAPNKIINLAAADAAANCPAPVEVPTTTQTTPIPPKPHPVTIRVSEKSLNHGQGVVIEKIGSHVAKVCLNGKVCIIRYDAEKTKNVSLVAQPNKNLPKPRGSRLYEWLGNACKKTVAICRPTHSGTATAEFAAR